MSLKYYLDTNIVIELCKRTSPLPPEIKTESYVSLLTIRELFKNINRLKKNKIKYQQNIKAIKWIHENQITIIWKTLTQVRGSAYYVEIEDPHSAILRKLFEEIVSSDEDKILELVSRSISQIEENNSWLSFFNNEMKKGMNGFVADSYLRNNLSSEQRTAFKNLLKSGGLLESWDSLYKDLFYTQGKKQELTLALMQTPLTETKEEIQAYYFKYNRSLDPAILSHIEFIKHRAFGRFINYNDIVDLLHTYYLNTPNSIMITDDQKLRKLVRNALGPERTKSYSQFLKLFQL